MGSGVLNSSFTCTISVQAKSRSYVARSRVVITFPAASEISEPRCEKIFLHLCENRDADHLRSVTAQLISAFVFRYIDSTIPLLSKSEISALKPSSVADRPVCVGTGRNPRRLVFSQRGSSMITSITMVA